MKNEVNNKSATDLVLSTQIQLEEPSLYQINLHNDDYTPMEFVVEILERFFFMDRRKATSIMFEAHIRGKAICGIFTKDVAETKTTQVLDYAKESEHPLICSMEAAV